MTRIIPFLPCRTLRPKSRLKAKSGGNYLKKIHEIEKVEPAISPDHPFWIRVRALRVRALRAQKESK
jgi:hypothetical protein